MTGHHSHQSSNNYACMDQHAIARTGLQSNKNGALFYYVQASCESMGQCPPYQEGAELACVVCTR